MSYTNSISSTKFSKSETLAALACAEVVKHHKLDSQIQDELLTQALFENLKNDELLDKINNPIEFIEKNVLPDAKSTLNNIYTNNEHTISEFDDIIDTTHQECDYDFLRTITNIYAKAYTKKLKA